MSKITKVSLLSTPPKLHSGVRAATLLLLATAACISPDSGDASQAEDEDKARGEYILLTYQPGGYVIAPGIADWRHTAGDYLPYEWGMSAFEERGPSQHCREWRVDPATGRCMIEWQPPTDIAQQVAAQFAELQALGEPDASVSIMVRAKIVMGYDEGRDEYRYFEGVGKVSQYFLMPIARPLAGTAVRIRNEGDGELLLADAWNGGEWRGMYQMPIAFDASYTAAEQAAFRTAIDDSDFVFAWGSHDLFDESLPLEMPATYTVSNLFVRVR